MSSRRWVAVSCTHGYYLDPVFAAQFLPWCADYRPDLRIHLGDAFDLESIRSGATDEDRAKGLDEDINAGLEFLGRYFQPTTENHFLRGNHDERLWKMRHECNGIRREYAARVADEIESRVRDLRATMLPYHVKRGVLRRGLLVFIHGISYAKTAGQIHANAYCEPGGTVVFGHTHTTGQAAIEQDPRPKYWLNAGCGRTLCPEYAERRIATLRWEHAWAYGEIHDDGRYTAHLLRLDPQPEAPSFPCPPTLSVY